MRTTIVISPRERFTAITESLHSLFRTIGPEVPVIVVEGCSSAAIRAELKSLQAKRLFRHVALSYMVTPNEARNIGGRLAETDYIVFADNDIEYTPGWLEALERNADQHGSVGVAPLIFIGPTPERTIHHAGGILQVREAPGGGTLLTERHRLMNADYETVVAELPALAPVENDVCEFHCMLMRREFFNRMGGLDERLITREHMDFALRVKAAGEKITFERDSHVTYRAFDPFIAEDLAYHLFRWSDERAVASIEAFQATWGVTLEADRIRFRWIQKHRDRAIGSAHPRARRLLGSKGMRMLISKRLEERVRRQDQRNRASAPPVFYPEVAVPRTARELVVND